MAFTIYDAASGGNLMWGPETHAAIPVSSGLFSVGLGSQTSGGIPATVWNGDRYLEITVGGETLTPRELIRSVPIAGMALTVPNGAITTAEIADGAVTQAKAPRLLGSLATNQFVQTGKITVNLQPGWNVSVAVSTFSTVYATSPIVVATSFEDNVANSAINILASSTTQGVNWNIWSGHSSGTRTVMLNWIAVGQ